MHIKRITNIQSELGDFVRPPPTAPHCSGTIGSRRIQLNYIDTTEIPHIQKAFTNLVEILKPLTLPCQISIKLGRAIPSGAQAITYLRACFNSTVCRPESWIRGIGGSCYKFSSNTLGWNLAKFVCEGLGSKLAMLTSEAENQLLAPKVSTHSWIGLHRDPKIESRWLWVDGSHATYTSWNRGEPNNINGPEDCVELYPASNNPGKWNDAPCTNPRHYICEIKGKKRTFLKQLCLTCFFK